MDRTVMIGRKARGAIVAGDSPKCQPTYRPRSNYLNRLILFGRPLAGLAALNVLVS